MPPPMQPGNRGMMTPDGGQAMTPSMMAMQQQYPQAQMTPSQTQMQQQQQPQVQSESADQFSGMNYRRQG